MLQRRMSPRSIGFGSDWRAHDDMTPAFAVAKASSSGAEFIEQLREESASRSSLASLFDGLFKRSPGELPFLSHNAPHGTRFMWHLSDPSPAP